jgi:hypothetical protein
MADILEKAKLVSSGVTVENHMELAMVPLKRIGVMP